MSSRWPGVAILLVLFASVSCAAPAAAPSAGAPPAPAGATAPTPSEWERTVAAAEQEGRVTVSGPPGDLVRRRMVEDFRKAYPKIEVEWTGNAGAEQVAKLETERRAGLYTLDVFVSGTSFTFSVLRPNGMLDPIPPALLLPEVTDPKNWLGNQLEYSDNERQYNLVFATTVPPIVAYDPKQVEPQEIGALSDVVAPKWNGKLLVNEPLPGGGPAIVNFRWFWHTLGPERTAAFARAVKAQAGAITKDQRQQVEWVARGRYPVLLGPSVGVLRQMEQQGLQVGEITEFKDIGGRTTPSFGSLMLLNRAPHPNAAKVFINWLLTREGQTAWSTAMSDASRRLDVSKDHLPAEAVPKPNGQYWPSYAEENAEIAPGLKTLIEEVF
jgi:iron(III) transport system substrate-binding protein